MVTIEGFTLPDDLYYTDRNLWVKPESDGSVRIGFNDLAAKAIGKVAAVRLMPEGRKMEKGSYLGSIESAKWVERLRSPIAGTLIEVNEELRTKPTLINQDPYGAGWFVRIEPAETINLQEELEKLVHGEAIKQFLEEQIAKIVKKK